MQHSYRGFTLNQILNILDHSILRPNATESEVLAACDLAVGYETAAVCVRPIDVAAAAPRLVNSKVALATVIGFPHGTSTSKTKFFEAQDAISNGARELDVVINLSELISGKYVSVRDELAAIVGLASTNRSIIKVILETCYLSEAQIVKGCEIAMECGAQFVKTSTGFGSAGATLEHVKIMRKVVGDSLGVKASGGINQLDFLLDLLHAGASRIGTSATESIAQQFQSKIQETDS